MHLTTDGNSFGHTLLSVSQVISNCRTPPDYAKLKQEAAEKYFYGIDKEIDLVKIAKAYMAIVGDGRGGIVSKILSMM